MLKQIKRWLIGTLALTLIALAALLTPILSSHAAAPHHSTSILVMLYTRNFMALQPNRFLPNALTID